MYCVSIYRNGIEIDMRDGRRYHLCEILLAVKEMFKLITHGHIYFIFLKPTFFY